MAAVDAELGPLPGLAVGVGVVRAAATMARLLAVHSPKAVVLVGSCGVYGDAFEVGTAVVARRMGLADGATALGFAYSPLAPAPLVADSSLVRGCSAPQADVLTVGAISTEPALVAAVGNGWQVEHLECFGVAWACAAAQVPFAAVLGIANEVGPTAHQEWKANRVRAETAAREAAGRIVSVIRSSAG